MKEMEEASGKFCLIFFFLVLSQSVLASKYSISREKPCKHFVLYYHDLLFNGNANNSTSAQVTNATQLGKTNFRMLVNFDDPLTRDNRLLSPPIGRAQGFYFYDKKDGYNAWFAYTLVFNSSHVKGTLNVIGADLMADRTRDLSVVGGTGDFFGLRWMLSCVNVMHENC